MDRLDLALYDALPPARRAALDRALKGDPALAAAFAGWGALRRRLGADLEAALPDRALLVLAVLAEEDPDLLDPDERAAWEAARDALHAAEAQTPVLADLRRQVRRDRALFEETWAEFEALEAVPPPVEEALLREAREAARRAPNGHARLAGRAPDRRPRPRAYRDRPLLRWGWRAAALGAVVVMAVFAVQLALRDAGLTTVRTGPNETRGLTLADGTRITLDQNSAVQVVTDADHDAPRQARLLAGRVLFEVVRDPEAPFAITTPVAEVAVLGTTFALETEEYETEVWLYSGAVTLAPRGRPDEAVRLAPGEESRVLGDRAPDPPHPARLDTALDWTGRLFFRGQTVEAIAARLADRFEIPVRVDASLQHEVVSLQVDASTPRGQILDLLARSVDAAAVRVDGGGYEIVPRAAE